MRLRRVEEIKPEWRNGRKARVSRKPNAGFEPLLVAGERVLVGDSPNCGYVQVEIVPPVAKPKKATAASKPAVAKKPTKDKEANDDA